MSEESRAPLCVLVVDDDADTVETTAVVLSLHGFHVLTATTGEEALRVTESGSPDVVLADLVMPKLDGFELARRLRAVVGAAGRPPLLVAVSGCASEGDRRKTTAAGFDLHLTKPADLDDLREALDEFGDRLAQE